VKGRFKDDEAGARNDRRACGGAASWPAGFSARAEDRCAVGAACRSDKDREIREVLFRKNRRCSRLQHQGQIRGPRAGNGNVGIYHLQGAGATPPDQAGSLVLQRGRCAAAGFARRIIAGERRAKITGTRT